MPQLLAKLNILKVVALKGVCSFAMFNNFKATPSLIKFLKIC